VCPPHGRKPNPGSPVPDCVCPKAHNIVRRDCIRTSEINQYPGNHARTVAVAKGLVNEIQPRQSSALAARMVRIFLSSPAEWERRVRARVRSDQVPLRIRPKRGCLGKKAIYRRVKTRVDAMPTPGQSRTCWRSRVGVRSAGAEESLHVGMIWRLVRS